ncbi:MAG: GNAT family N-acetyltransferase [Magnetococcales bacterium]|nr:GNAT family N-acetyltransferase [Magnetococcales bacterium]
MNELAAEKGIVSERAAGKMDRIQLARKVRAIKQVDGGQCDFDILVRRSDGKVIGRLSPLRPATLGEGDLIAKLTAWRSRWMHCFLTQFAATPSRTAKWLERVVLPSDERVLFLIHTEAGVPVGHIGVCGLSPERAELDNLVRGEVGGDIQLIYYAAQALLRWICGELKILTINLHVLSSNSRAIILYERLGFRQINRERLYREITADGVNHYSGERREGDEEANFQYIEMVLACENTSCSDPA